MAKTKEDVENIVMAEDASTPPATGSSSGSSETSGTPPAAEQTYAVKLRCPIYDKAGAPPHKPGEVLNVVAETARLWTSLNLVTLQPGVKLPDPENADDVDDYPTLPVSRVSEVIVV
ncbi:hypothetical protein FAI40_01665 [Acetobacteraceae bacterium]|nr:hypothetical protein FAI40_01665 [Acetobacteraceae bacterium]